MLQVRLMLLFAVAGLLGTNASASEPVVARVGERGISVAAIKCDGALPAEYCNAAMQANLNTRIADAIVAAATQRAGVRLTSEETAAFKKNHVPSDASISSLERGWKAAIEGAKLVQGGLTADEAYERAVKPAGMSQAVFSDFLGKVQTDGALQAFAVGATSAALRAQLEHDAEMQLKLERIDASLRSSCGGDAAACERARAAFWEDVLRSHPIRILDARFHAELPTFIPGERHDTQ